MDNFSHTNIHQKISYLFGLIHNPTIGLILCENKKSITVEYAIEGIKSHIGISQFKLTEQLPEELRKYLPTKEELTKLR